MIRRVAWQSFRVPLRAEFRATHGTMDARDGLIVTVEDDSGAIGLGEASPLPSYSGGTVEETAGVVAALAARLLGKPAVAAWDEDSASSASAGSVAAARCGIETATAAIAARADRVPLARWMATRAGLPTRLPKVIEVNGTIDASEPASAAREARALAERGFRTLKVKVGTGQEADVARVRAVRGAVGAGVELRVDANGAWSSYDEAFAVMDQLAGERVPLCEQPIGHRLPGALETMARLRRTVPITLAADESCRTLADIEAIQATRAAGVVVIKPMASGLREALAMVAFARGKRAIIVTTMFDTGIGTMAALQLAAVAGPRRMACGLATLDHLEHPLAAGVPAVEGGAMRVPRRPGLGVRLHEAGLGSYATGVSGEVRL